MNRTSLALLLTLAAVWGGSFLFIRIAVASLGPTVLVDLRVASAAAVLGIVLLVRRQGIALGDGRWWRFLILGTINAALPFTLISFAELHLNASYASILNATTPLFTVLISAVWLRDRITPKKAAGVLLGIAGVAVLVGLTPQRLDAALLVSVGASLAAALFYGLGSTYAARSFRGVPPLHMSFSQQAAAAVVLAPIAITHRPPTWGTPGTWLALLALGILCTAVAYLLYFRLIAQVGATNTTVVTLLVPVFGILWGALFLREPITLATLGGAAIIFASVALVTNLQLSGRKVPAPSEAVALGEGE